MKILHRPGIEPGPPAWQASILPLNHRCCLNLSHTSLDYKAWSTILALSLLQPDSMTTVLSVTFLPWIMPDIHWMQTWIFAIVFFSTKMSTVCLGSRYIYYLFTMNNPKLTKSDFLRLHDGKPAWAWGWPHPSSSEVKNAWSFTSTTANAFYLVIILPVNEESSHILAEYENSYRLIANLFFWHLYSSFHFFTGTKRKQKKAGVMRSLPVWFKSESVTNVCSKYIGR